MKSIEQQIAKEFKDHKHYAASMEINGRYGGKVYYDRKGKVITWNQFNTLVEKDINRRTKRIIDKLTGLGQP
jgi:hypothetical protein